MVRIELIEYLNLSSLNHLRTLRLDELKHPAIQSILATLPNPVPLKRLTLAVEFNHVGHFVNKSYASLDEFLASEKFPDAMEIWLDYKGSLNDDQVQGKLSRVFRRVHKNGVLGVSRVVREYYDGPN